jgi:hypothetical protein
MKEIMTRGTKKEIKKSIVDHTYRDFSQVTTSDLEECRNLNVDLFPSKLHRILSTPSYAHIIAWRPHGRAWEILDRSLFLSIVVPEHFHHSNMGSFNRSVNGWGFKVSFNYQILPKALVYIGLCSILFRL